MSKRNFILLIIILIILGLATMGFLYYRQSLNPRTQEEGGTNFISRFNPFASIDTTQPETKPEDISGYQPNPIDTSNAKLKKVSSMGIAGFTIYSKERLKEVPEIITPTEEPKEEETEVTATTPLPETKPKTTPKPTAPATEFASSVRYVDKASGNIYQTFADKIEERKFSTTLIPKIYEAFFTGKGANVVMRYLKEDGRTIQTFVGNLPKEFLGADTTAENEIEGSFLTENIVDISMSQDLSSIFYLFNSGDSIIGTTFNILNNKKAQIFESSFTEWLSFWPNSKMITLTTKPSYLVGGYMYTIDLANNNAFKKIFGGIQGLTTLTSPDGKLVLYGTNNLSLNVFHMDTKISDSFSIRTLPEKCTWGKLSDVIYCAVPQNISGQNYPDTWYQGEVSFSDQIWKVDVKTGITTLLLNPIDIVGGEEVDGIKLALDENEDYLFFINKKDSFLWEFDLK